MQWKVPIARIIKREEKKKGMVREDWFALQGLGFGIVGNGRRKGEESG